MANHYTKDLFISYAHIDNETLAEGQKGWITTFHRALEVRLSQLLGEKPKIWRDQKLQGNDFFGDEIIDQFPQVALIVSVFSPRYTKSEWCLRELNTFMDVARQNDGLKIGNKSRIFKVIKTPVPFDEHPPTVRDILGYEFYSVDSSSGRPKEFNQNPGSGTEQEYWTKLDDLAHDMADLLNEIKQQANTSPSAPATQSPQGNTSDEDPITVYIAESSSDVKEQRERIARELKQYGYQVIPDHPLPFIKEEIDGQVQEYLKQSDLAVHVFGANYGVVPEGTNKSFPVLQNEIAAQASQDNAFKRFIWMPPDVQFNEERQQQFIEHLKADSFLQTNAELYQAPIEDLKFAIHSEIQHIIAQKQQASQANQADPATVEEDMPKQVYLICDQRDLDETAPIEDFLFDQGFEVILPVFEGDESAIRLDHQENMKLCDACLIYFGHGNELWMRAKSRELLKIAGYGREKKLLAKGVYLAPPDNQAKKRFRSRDAIIMDGRQGFQEHVLHDFITKLHTT